MGWKIRGFEGANRFFGAENPKNVGFFEKFAILGVGTRKEIITNDFSLS